MNIKKIQGILITISVIIIIILGPLIIFSFSKPFYDAHIQRTDFSIGKENASELTSNVLNFLNGKELLKEDFTDEEKSHMEDVKKIFLLAKILLGIALIIIIASIMSAVILKQEYDYKSIRNASAISFIFMLGMLLLILISFQSGFTAFHNIFFPQGNWQFPIDSMLITLFPEEFFIRISTAIFITSIIISIVAYTTTVLKIKSSRHNHSA